MSGLVKSHLSATSQRVKDKPTKLFNMRLHTFLTFFLSVISITIGILLVTLFLTLI